MNAYTIRPAVLKEAEQIFDLIRLHKDDLISRPIGDFIQSLDLPAADKSRLLALTPSTYVGLASRLVDCLIKEVK